jgi:hypothetical protein
MVKPNKCVREIVRVCVCVCEKERKRENGSAHRRWEEGVVGPFEVVRYFDGRTTEERGEEIDEAKVCQWIRERRQPMLLPRSSLQYKKRKKERRREGEKERNEKRNEKIRGCDQLVGGELLPHVFVVHTIGHTKREADKLSKITIVRETQRKREEGGRKREREIKKERERERGREGGRGGRGRRRRRRRY